MRGHRAPLRESLAIKPIRGKPFTREFHCHREFSGVVGRVAFAVTGDQFEKCGALLDVALGVEAVRREGELRGRAAE